MQNVLGAQALLDYLDCLPLLDSVELVLLLAALLLE